MSTPDAVIIVAPNSNSYVNGANLYDMVFATTSNTQGFIFGYSNPYLRITSNGYVGIGTSNPTSMLQVAGSILPAADALYDLGSSNLRFKTLYITSNTLDLGGTRLKVDSTGALNITNSNGSNANITAAQILIGNGSNLVSLQLNSSNNLQFVSATVSNGIVTQSSNVVASGGGWSNNSANVFVLSSNVGIGLSNPIVPLHITGTATQLAISTTGTTAFTTLYGGDSTYGAALCTSNSMALRFGQLSAIDGTITEYARIQTNGNVGIRTSAPAYALDVIGTAKASTFLITGSAGTGFTNASNYPGLFIGATNTQNAVIVGDILGKSAYTIGMDQNDSKFKIQVGGGLGTGVFTSPRMTITNTSVGIGTSNPAYTLDVNGSVNMFATSNAGYTGYALGIHILSMTRNLNDTAVSAGGNMRFFTNSTAGPSTGTSAMYINTSGNVGIGTISPASKLEVTGQITLANDNNWLTGGIRFRSVNGTLDGAIVQGTNGAIYFRAPSLDGSYGYSFMNNTGTVYLLTIANSGNVGIGTSTPSYKLHVDGNVGCGNLTCADLTPTGKIVVQNEVDGTSAKGIYLWAANDSGWGIYMGKSGAGKSLKNGFAVAGNGFNDHAVRFRCGASGTQGFVFENHSEQLLHSIRGSDGLAYFAGNVTCANALTATGNLTCADLTPTGKIVVQNGVDGTSAKGIYMWSANTTSWGIYMGQSGAGKSLNNGNAVAGNGFGGHAVRFRCNAVATDGFVFENHSEQLLLSIRGSDGYAYFAGDVTCAKTVSSGTLTVGASAITSSAANKNIMSSAGFGPSYNVTEVTLAPLIAPPVGVNDSVFQFKMANLNLPECYLGSPLFTVTQGTTYTVSYWLRLDVGQIGHEFWAYNRVGGAFVGTTWQRWAWTFTADAPSVSFRMDMNGGASTMYFTGFKLEASSSATDFVPYGHPENLTFGAITAPSMVTSALSVVRTNVDRSAPTLVATTTGNVGIGTSTPAYTLDVNGSVNTTTLRCATLSNSGNIDTGPIQRMTSVNLGLTAIPSSAAFVSSNFYFQTESMYISKNSITNLDGMTRALQLTTSSPPARLTGVGNSWLYMQGILNSIGAWNGGAGATADMSFRLNDIEYMHASAGGNVGIGISNPAYRLDVAGSVGCSNLTATGAISAASATFTGSVNTSVAGGKYFETDSSTLLTFAANLQPLSIYAEFYILSKRGFLASSDLRIKQNITLVSTNLNMIDVIDVVSYQYIDKVLHGNKTKIGYIAQEIHKVIPEAVAKRVDWVADIFQIASHVDPETKQITVLNHQLIVGTTIKLVSMGGDSNGFSAQVSRVINADTFSVSCTQSLDSQVFVYGRQVDDFHDIDYDMLSAVAFGGVKELHVKHKELESRFSALEELINKMISQNK